MRYIIITMLSGLFVLGAAHQATSEGVTLKGNKNGIKLYSDGTRTYASFKHCMQWKAAQKVGATRFGEHPFVEWTVGGVQYIMMANPEKGTVSILTRHPKDLTKVCALIDGVGMKVPTVGESL